MDITIRRGVPADAGPLADLAASTFRDTYAVQNRAEDMALYVSRVYGLSQQETELSDPEMTTVLAEVDGQLAEGRGVAHALMRRVELEARARAAHTLWLGVWERNERAKSFYRKCGFADVGSQVFMLGTDAQTDRILVRLLPSGPQGS